MILEISGEKNRSILRNYNLFQNYSYFLTKKISKKKALFGLFWILEYRKLVAISAHWTERMGWILVGCIPVSDADAGWCCCCRSWHVRRATMRRISHSHHKSHGFVDILVQIYAPSKPIASIATPADMHSGQTHKHTWKKNKHIIKVRWAYSYLLLSLTKPTNLQCKIPSDRATSGFVRWICAYSLCVVLYEMRYIGFNVNVRVRNIEHFAALAQSERR